MSASAQELQLAFQEFTALSEQLTSSYNELQSKIVRLTEELEEAKRQRAEQLEQKQQVAEKLEHLLFLLPAGVVVIDGAGMVVSANPAAEMLLGSPLVDSPWVAVIERCFEPKHHDGYEISLKDGRLVSIATRSLEQEPGQMVVITDMTETRRLQEQVSRSERLTEMGRMVASLAHQIRTPLSAAMLYAGHLESEELSEANRVKFASKLQGRLRNLEQQIGDMLQFARGGSTVAEQFDLQSFYAVLRNAVEPIFSGIGVSCVWKLNAEVAVLLGHSEALTGAVVNLVNNAVQAGAKEICISADIENQDLLLVVSDDGPGIPEALKAKVLEPFYTTKTQGTGLGLAIVQSVVNAHKGALSVESTDGQGSQFIIRLPLVSS